MSAEIAVEGAGTADLTRDLIAWLAEEPGLRGRVHLVERDSGDYALGPGAAAVEALLESGSAVTALASVAITWLRCRTGKVSLSISGRNGRPDVNITAERVKSLDPDGVRDLIAQVSDVLRGDQPAQGGLEGDGHDSA